MQIMKTNTSVKGLWGSACGISPKQDWEVISLSPTGSKQLLYKQTKANKNKQTNQTKTNKKEGMISGKKVYQETSWKQNRRLGDSEEKH